MSLLLLTYGYDINRLTHGSIYIFSNRMQRTLNVLFVESCASNPSSSTVTLEVDSSNANVEGLIATSSGTTTTSSDACDNVSYPKQKQSKSMMKMSISQTILFPLLFLSWYAKDQLRKLGISL